MKWFGENWGAPICETTPQVEVPAVACHLCKSPIDDVARGITMPFAGGPVEGVPSFYDEDDGCEAVACHLACFIRSVLPDEPDPEEEIDVDFESMDLAGLEQDLQELEKTDPKVRKAREDLDRTVDQLLKRS